MRRRAMTSRWLSAAMVFASLTANVHAAEIEFRHINDLFSASPIDHLQIVIQKMQMVG